MIYVCKFPKGDNILQYFLSRESAVRLTMMIYAEHSPQQRSSVPERVHFIRPRQDDSISKLTHLWHNIGTPLLFQ